MLVIRRRIRNSWWLCRNYWNTTAATYYGYQIQHLFFNFRSVLLKDCQLLRTESHWLMSGIRLWSTGGIILTAETKITHRKTCSGSNLSTTNPTPNILVLNPGLRSDRPATNCPSHGTTEELFSILRNYGFERRLAWSLAINQPGILLGRMRRKLKILRIRVVGFPCQDSSRLSSRYRKMP